jgi:hypothetical protein
MTDRLNSAGQGYPIAWLDPFTVLLPDPDPAPKCESRCVYCGRDMLENYIIHIFGAEREHLLPAGEYPELAGEPSNWVVSCHSCNKVKGSLDVNVGYGEPRYVKGSCRHLSDEDREVFIGRIVHVNEVYSERYEETFAKQKKILLGVLSRPEQAKVAHN